MLSGSVSGLAFKCKVQARTIRIFVRRAFLGDVNSFEVRSHSLLLGHPSACDMVERLCDSFHYIFQRGVCCGLNSSDVSGAEEAPGPVGNSRDLEEAKLMQGNLGMSGAKICHLGGVPVSIGGRWRAWVQKLSIRSCYRSDDHRSCIKGQRAWPELPNLSDLLPEIGYHVILDAAASATKLFGHPTYMK